MQMVLETLHILDRPHSQDRQFHSGFLLNKSITFRKRAWTKLPASHMFLDAAGGWLRFVHTSESNRVFYGWWIVVAAFLNLFFAVGVVFYGFPVFYPALADSLGFTRAQLTQGFLLGFLIAGLPFGLLDGGVTVRIGENW